MTHECGDGFVTVKIGDRVIDLCETCAEVFIKVAADLDFQLKGKSRIDRIFLSRNQRHERVNRLKSKVDDFFSDVQDAPGAVFFFGLSDDDLVRLTDEPYIETGTPDD